MTVLVGSGCSVALRHEPLSSPAQTYSDQIAVSRRAEGIDGKVGWGRFTVFYIPLVPIYIEGGDGNEKVMEQIRGALQRVGYKVTVVDSATPPPAPILKCKVEKFWFNNYTWFFPVVPTWGEVHLTLSLLSRDGKLLWSRDFTGDGSTFDFTDGYSTAANKSMQKILNDMVREFASQEFHRALNQG
jgi:hypothetical protein